MDLNSSVNFNDGRPCSSGKRNADIHPCGDTEWLPILIPVNCFIFIMGVFPNILVVYLIYSRKILRERYIMNVSVSASHILFCVLVPPLVIDYHVTSNPTTSRAREFVVCCVVSVTSLTMAVLAARRALALSETFRYKLGEFTFKSKLIAKLIIWMSSIGIAVPLTVDACVALSPFSMITYRVSEIGANSGNNNKSFSCTNRTGDDVLLRSSGDIPCHAYSVTIARLLIYFICSASLILTENGYRCITRRPNQKLWEKELMIKTTFCYDFYFPCVLDTHNNYKLTERQRRCALWITLSVSARCHGNCSRQSCSLLHIQRTLSNTRIHVELY